MRRLNCLMVALLLASTFAAKTAAQEAVSADALGAAQKLAGSATVTRARVIVGDSLLIDVDDQGFSMEGFENGVWRFGGREQKPKEVGRQIAEAIAAKLPSSSNIKVAIVTVRGTGNSTIRLHYLPAELQNRLPDLRRPR